VYARIYCAKSRKFVKNCTTNTSLLLYVSRALSPLIKHNRGFLFAPLDIWYVIGLTLLLSCMANTYLRNVLRLPDNQLWPGCAPKSWSRLRAHILPSGTSSRRPDLIFPRVGSVVPGNCGHSSKWACHTRETWTAFPPEWMRRCLKREKQFLRCAYASVRAQNWLAKTRLYLVVHKKNVFRRTANKCLEFAPDVIVLLFAGLSACSICWQSYFVERGARRSFWSGSGKIASSITMICSENTQPG
jgi:hypothetical protein